MASWIEQDLTVERAIVLANKAMEQGKKDEAEQLRSVAQRLHERQLDAERLLGSLSA